MARKPEGSAAPQAPSDREKIVDAFMALLAEHAFERIGFADVAARSGVALHRCRAEFDTTLGIIGGFMRSIDEKVLAGMDPDMAEEPPRERLFDVLMRRLEALAPHKAAIRSLTRSLRCNPLLALALNGFAARSQSWMLTAAGIDSTGLRGMVRAQGLACLYADVMRIWLRDDDPGLARTMAALDRALARGARWARGLDDLARMAVSPCRVARGFRRRGYRRRDDDPADQPAVV